MAIHSIGAFFRSPISAALWAPLGVMGIGAAQLALATGVFIYRRKKNAKNLRRRKVRRETGATARKKDRRVVGRKEKAAVERIDEQYKTSKIGVILAQRQEETTETAKNLAGQDVGAAFGAPEQKKSRTPKGKGASKKTSTTTTTTSTKKGRSRKKGEKTGKSTGGKHVTFAPTPRPSTKDTGGGLVGKTGAMEEQAHKGAEAAKQLEKETKTRAKGKGRSKKGVLKRRKTRNGQGKSADTTTASRMSEEEKNALHARFKEALEKGKRRKEEAGLIEPPGETWIEPLTREQKTAFNSQRKAKILEEKRREAKKATEAPSTGTRRGSAAVLRGEGKGLLGAAEELHRQTKAKAEKREASQITGFEVTLRRKGDKKTKKGSRRK